MRLCANQICMAEFSPSRHNQIYCGEECRRQVTNSRIMVQYYEKKDIKSGKERRCVECRVSKLSRYNEGNTCYHCVARRATTARQNLLNALGVE